MYNYHVIGDLIAHHRRAKARQLDGKQFHGGSGLLVHSSARSTEADMYSIWRREKKIPF